jgi:hypothetical protein
MMGGKAGCFDKSQVGRDRVTGFQHNDVAGHHLLGSDETHMAISPHAGGARAERAQRLDGARRLELC